MKKIIVILIIIAIIVGGVLFFTKRSNQSIEVVEGSSHDTTEYSNNSPRKEISISEDRIEKYTNVTDPEGVSTRLINDDEALDYIMKYAPLFYSNNATDLDKNKIYMSLESVIGANTDEDNSMEEIPKKIVEMAYKELFESKEINHVDSYNYKYDSSKNTYLKKNEVEAVDRITIVKITKKDDQKDYKEIEYYYAYIKDENEMDQPDCYKTTIKVKTNNQYSFSKYKLIDIDKIDGVYVGKVYENR